MKYRLDLVTNSSSSSYVCDVCGCVESGWDMGLSEAEMYECVNGHTVCESHVDFSDEAKMRAIEKYLDDDFDYKDYEKTKEELLKELEESEDFREEFMNDHMEIRYYLPAEMCPICNLDSLQDDDKLYYLLKKNNIDVKDLEKTIRDEFKTHDELQKYIRG